MANEKKERKQVNIDFEPDPELLAALDEMRRDDDMNRSQFVRKLVRQEKARRAALMTQPIQTVKKNNHSAQALAA